MVRWLLLLSLLLPLLMPLQANAEVDGGPPDAGAPDAGPIVLLPCEQAADEGCSQLAGALASGVGAPRDPARAATLYSRACAAGRGDACRNLGGLFEAGVGTATSFSTAFRFLSKACDLNDAPGCLEAGALLLEGVGVKPSLPEATRLLQHACDLGNGTGCLRVAGLADLSLAGADAGDLYRRACAEGEKSACFNVDTSVAQQTEACEQSLDALACWVLGDVYLDGTGVKKSPATAARFYQRACDGTEGEACTSLAQLYLSGKGVKKSARQAMALFRRACVNGDDTACARFVKPPRR